MDECPRQRRQEALAFGSRDRRVSERLALLDVARSHQHARQHAHGVRRPPESRQRGAEVLLGRGVLAAIGVTDREHRPRPAGLSGVADVLGKAPSAPERGLRGLIAALDRGNPATLGLDLGHRRAVAELVRKAERSLQVARPFAGRAQPAAGVRGRAEDQGPRFECTVSALAGLARRTQRDVSRAGRVTGREAHLRDVEEGARLDVEAQQRLGRGAGRSVERARDGGRRFYRELVAVATCQTGDVRARAFAIAARGVDLDDQLVQHIVERFAAERSFRQCERAVGLAVG